MATSRTRTSGANAASTALYQLVLVGASLIIPRILIANYGSEMNGLVTSLTQFVSYFTVVEAGIAGAATFALYRPLADKNWLGVSRVVSAARQFYVRVGFVFVGLVLGLAIIYPILITVTSLTGWAIGLLVFALGASGFLDFFTLSKYRALLTADKRTWVVQLSSCVFVVLNTAVIAVLGMLRVDITIVYILAVLPTLVRAAILMMYAKRKYPNVEYYARPTGGELHQRWDAFFLQALSATQTAAPTLIATIMLPDLTAVSVFSVYMLVSLGCQRVANVLGTGMQAVFGEVLVKEKIEVLQRAYREYELLVLSITAVICGTALGLVMPFITLYTAGITSDDYYFPVLGVLTVICVFTYQIKAPHGLMVVAAGMFRETRWRTLTQSLILLVSSTVLSIWLGFYGIMFGIILSNLYRTVDLAFHISREVTDLPPVRSFYRMGLAAVQVVIIGIPMWLWGPSFNGWLMWLAAAVTVSIWGTVVVIGINMLSDREDTLRLARRAISVLRRG